MLRKDKALLEGLTRKYGKRNILNEIYDYSFSDSYEELMEKIDELVDESVELFFKYQIEGWYDFLVNAIDYEKFKNSDSLEIILNYSLNYKEFYEFASNNEFSIKDVIYNPEKYMRIKYIRTNSMTGQAEGVVLELEEENDEYGEALYDLEQIGSATNKTAYGGGGYEARYDVYFQVVNKVLEIIKEDIDKKRRG